MYVPQNGIEVIVSSCQSQEGGFKLKCSSTTLHFIFLLQTDFTVGEDAAVWNFEYWCQPPACIFFQSAYFVWMMRHIVGRVISSEQRHCLKGTDTDFQQMPFLLVRAVKDDPWKCNLFNGPIKEHRTPRSSSVTKMVDIPLTRELPERPAQCFSCQSSILSPFIMRVGDFTLQSWNLSWFKWASSLNSVRKAAQKS